MRDIFERVESGKWKVECKNTLSQGLFVRQHSNKVPLFNSRMKQPFLLRQVSLPRNRPNTSQNALKE